MWKGSSIISLIARMTANAQRTEYIIVKQQKNRLKIYVKILQGEILIRQLFLISLMITLAMCNFISLILIVAWS